MARAAFNIGDTTEDTVDVNEINLVPVDEAEHVKKVISIRTVEISITTWAEESDVVSASDIEKWTIEKVSVVAKGEAAKDSKIGTNTWMKKYLRCDKCVKYLSLILIFL